MGKGEIRLFCLPFAGGNSYSYRDWQKKTADFVDVVPIELPGRGRRSAEPLLRSTDQLAEDIFRQIESLLCEPYAVYGHSFGACLSYLLTRRIIAAGLPEPMHLFCSGRQAPCVKKDRDNRHQLPRPEFIEMLREMGGCPEEILNDDELMDYFEPIIRADFQADADYAYQQVPAFDIPLTVMIGLQDGETTREGGLQWQRETVRGITFRSFQGGHFFIFVHLDEIGRLISDSLGD